MQRYVAGFLMNEDYVYLVRKTKPQQLAGKLNGIGGKVDSTEKALHAMGREWWEETGTHVGPWLEFCRLRGDYALAETKEMFEVVFYFAPLIPEVFYTLRAKKNDAGELMDWYSIKYILADPKGVQLMPNCTWLIPMARSLAMGERANNFVVTEAY